MRRPTSAWTRAILGTALTASTLMAQQVASSRGRGTGSPSTPEISAAPVMTGRSARNLVRNGWDYINYQEYERALAFFREAEKRGGELSDAERRDLRKGIDAAQRGLRDASNGTGRRYARSVRDRRPGAIALARPARETGRDRDRDRSDAGQVQLASGTAPAEQPRAEALAPVPVPAQIPAPLPVLTAAPGRLEIDRPQPPVESSLPAASLPPMPPVVALATPGTAADLAPKSTEPEPSPAPAPVAAPVSVSPDPATPAPEPIPPPVAAPTPAPPTPIDPPAPAEVTKPIAAETAKPAPTETTKPAPVPVAVAEAPRPAPPAEPEPPAPRPVPGGNDVGSVALPPLSNEPAAPAEPPAARPDPGAKPAEATGELPPAPAIPAAPDESLPPLPDMSALPPAPAVGPPTDSEPEPATPKAEAAPVTAPPSVSEPLPPLPDEAPPRSEAAPAAAPAPVRPGPEVTSPPVAAPSREPARALATPTPAEESEPLPPLPAEAPASAPAAVEAPRPRPRPEPARSASAAEAFAPPAVEAAEPPAEVRATEPIAVPTPAPAPTEPARDSFVPERRSDSSSTLPPDLQREVEEIVLKQEKEAQAQRERAPAQPPVATDQPAAPGQPPTRLEISRAPSAVEARPLRAIPVPEEFVPLPKRDWAPNRKYWAGAGTCHLPLYFQDAALERYGHSTETFFGPIGRRMTYPLDDPSQSNQRNQIAQPFLSAGLFVSQIILLPYNLIVDPPWEAEYDLGYFRPGDRVPNDIYYLPLHGVGPPLRGRNY